MSDPIFYGKPLRFNPNNHRYYWDGQPVPSVTTIIGRLSKPLLIQWAADMAVDHIFKRYTPGTTAPAHFETICRDARKAHQVIKEDAGDVGKIVHRYAQAILEGKPSPTEAMPAQAANAVRAFLEWHSAHKVEPTAVERRVMSAKRMYAGTCDFFGRINGRLAVLDFKTGNGVYDEAWFQMAGYEMALMEELELGERPVHWLIHLNKNTGGFAAYDRGPQETEAAMAVWTCLVGLDRYMRQMPKMKKAAA